MEESGGGVVAYKGGVDVEDDIRNPPLHPPSTPLSTHSHTDALTLFLPNPVGINHLKWLTGEDTNDTTQYIAREDS